MLESFSAGYQSVQGRVTPVPDYSVSALLSQLDGNGQDDLIFRLDQGSTFHAQSERFPDRFAPSKAFTGLKPGDPVSYRGLSGRVVAYQDDSTSLGERVQKGFRRMLESISLTFAGWFRPS